MDVTQLVNDLMNDESTTDQNPKGNDILQRLGFPVAQNKYGGLWSTIKDAVKNQHPIGATVKDKTSLPEFFQVDDILNHLMNISKIIKNVPERDYLQGGLMYLHDQFETPKYQRDQIGIRDAWQGIYPILNKYQMLEAFPKGSWSRHRIMIFLMGDY